MPLGMLSLRGMHTFHPAIIQAKNFGHALRINTSPGACSLKYYSASLAWAQPTPISFRQVLEYTLGMGAAPEGYGGEGPMHGGSGAGRSFFVTFVLCYGPLAKATKHCDATAHPSLPTHTPSSTTDV